MLSLLFFYRNYGLTIEDEFELDDGIISGSFDNTFDMGIVGTLCGSLWYICWITDRSKTRLIASHTDIVTSSLDGTIRIFQLEDRNEVLCFNANELVNLKFSYLNIFYFHFCFFLESNLFNIMG
jgi:hypothetical protein